MSDDILLGIGIALLLSAFAVFGYFGVAEPEGGLRTRHRRRIMQRGKLERACMAARGNDLVINWLDYRELPKYELLDLLDTHGWHHVDQRIDATSWLLRFTRGNQATRPAANQRLHAELVNATPDINGIYELDLNNYLPMQESQVDALIQSAGWQRRSSKRDSPCPVLVLAPLDNPDVDRNGAFAGASLPWLGGNLAHAPALEDLVADPQVTARAAQWHSTLGFDPLSEVQLRRVRERYLAWQRRIAVPARFAGLYSLSSATVFAGVFVFDVDNPAMMLSIASLLLALGALCLVRVALLRRGRANEIGQALAAYRELVALHRG